MNEEFVLKEKDEPAARQLTLSSAGPKIVDATIRRRTSERCLQDDEGEAAKRDDIKVGLPCEHARTWNLGPRSSAILLAR
jgi:hypothetical protein